MNSEQPTNIDELESVDLWKSIEDYESELTNPQRPRNTYEPEPRVESVQASELEPISSGRRYPLQERRAPTTYANQYILLTDEGEPECYDKTNANEHREKWLSQ